MKAYIERPISEKPDTEGYYYFTKEGIISNSAYKYEEGQFAREIDKSGRYTHWLQPVEIPDPSPVVNTDVLAALKYVINCGDSCEKCIKVCEEALSQITPQPDKKEEKK